MCVSLRGSRTFGSRMGHTSSSEEGVRAESHSRVSILLKSWAVENTDRKSRIWRTVVGGWGPHLSCHRTNPEMP